ncbi:helix-turn-helix domain-containing protein [Streptomyces sp. NPDC050507]
MTPAETAAYLGVPVSSLYAQWRRWGLKGLKVGKHLRFRVADVDAWLMG